MERKTRLLVGSLRNIWALLLGMAILSLASGLQGSLLGLRASVEGFSNTSIGFMMSFYYAGFLGGSWYAPSFVRKVGHPRVFAAMASVSSITILCHYLIVSPEFWMLMRLINGFCFAGLFVATESWLNNMARNRVRGQIIAFYMMLQYLFLAGGFGFLNFAPPEEVTLYLLTSIMVSIALVPVLLSTGKTPRFNDIKKMSIPELAKGAPLGAWGAIGMGIVQSISLTMGIVYCQRIGMDIERTTILLMLFIIAGALAQWPVGRMSDRLDRRVMIALWSLLSAGAIFGVQWGVNISDTVVIAMMAVYGAASLCVYPMVVAHTNDRLKPNQMIGGSSTMFFLYGGAASVGPVLCSVFMEAIGPNGFTVILGVMHLWLGGYTIYRIVVREAVPIKHQVGFLPTAVPRGVSPLIKAVVKSAQRRGKKVNEELLEQKNS